MKKMVKLAVLLATLLLLTGAAFAEWCECYEVTVTSLDGLGPPVSIYAEICYGDTTGTINIGPISGPITLFFDRHPLQALGYSEECVAYFKFHEGLDIFNGIQECLGNRSKVRGLVTDYDNCFPG